MKKIIAPKSAPKALGPYSHAVVIGNTMFTSGQLGIDKEGNFVGHSAETQAYQALTNVKSLLDEAGFLMSEIVKTTVFISDMNDFASINAEYAKFFDGAYPARSCVEVARLPKDAKVEIEVIAIKE